MGTPAKASAAKPTDKPKDRVDLKLYNTIVIFDDYVIARSGETARETLLAAIASGDLKPMEVVAKETTMANSIRTSKLEEAPLVASDVTDEEFDKLRGITNTAAFERFYTRRS